MTIVVGYTPRPEGRAALDHAASEAARDGTHLVVVNASRGDALVDDRFAQAHDLADVRHVLDAAGVGYELRQLVRGKEGAEEVLAAAAETSASLVVIGVRRRTPVGKLIMGSNAQRILLEADCPVLAVKADGPRNSRGR